MKGRVKEYTNILFCKCIEISRRIYQEMITLVQERSQVLRERDGERFKYI